MATTIIYQKRGNDKVKVAETPDLSHYAIKADVDAELATKADAEDLGITDKRVDNVLSLLNGALSTQNTDSTSAYAKVVPAGAQPYAAIESVGGKTVVWNQLVRNGNFEATSNWVGRYATVSISENIATVTPTSDGTLRGIYSQSNIGIVNGHKYLLSGHIKSPITSTAYIAIGGVQTGAPTESVTADTWTNVSGIYDNVQATGNAAIYFLVTGNVTTAQTIQYKDIVVIDLTLLYGAGNEPATVADFQAQFPSIDPAYNPGELISAGVTGAVSVGKNLWDASKSQSGWIDPTGVVTIRGAIGSSSDIIGDYIPVTPGETICCAVNGALYGALAYWSEYTADKTFIQRTNASTCTPTANTFFVRLCLSSTAADAVTKNATCQVERGSTATAYTPYMTHTLPIPSAVQALPGYGYGLTQYGTTRYNYIDYKRKVFVKNLEKAVLDGVNLKVNQVVQYGSNYRFSTPVNSIKKPWYATGTLCASAPTMTDYDRVIGGLITTSTVDAIFYYGNNYNYIFYLSSSSGSNISTVDSMNAWLQEHPCTVYYRLETPEETDISQYLSDDNLIQVEPGSTVSFPSVLGDDYRIPVPSSVEYTINLAPDTPSTDGTYTLQCTVADGVATYSWVSA